MIPFGRVLISTPPIRLRQIAWARLAIEVLGLLICALAGVAIVGTAFGWRLP